MCFSPSNRRWNTTNRTSSDRTKTNRFLYNKQVNQVGSSLATLNNYHKHMHDTLHHTIGAAKPRPDITNFCTQKVKKEEEEEALIVYLRRRRPD